MIKVACFLKLKTAHMDSFRFISLLVAPCFLLLSMGFQDHKTFEAAVIAKDVSKQTLLLQTPDHLEPLLVNVSKGDFDIDYQNKKITGDLISTEQGLRLEKIWPVAPRWVNDTIKQIRQQTRSMSQRSILLPGNNFPQFSLCNTQAEYINKDAFKNKWFFVTTLFTRCGNPNMCPLVAKRMVNLEKKLAEENITDVHELILTFDPTYDTPGILRQYAESFNANLSHTHFLTGNKNHLDDLMKQIGILKRGGDDHTLCVMLVDPFGRIVYRQEGNHWTTENLYD